MGYCNEAGKPPRSKGLGPELRPTGNSIAPPQTDSADLELPVAVTLISPFLTRRDRVQADKN